MANDYKLVKGIAGTNAELVASNPILADDEFAYETDTGTVKRGDGSTAYADLDPWEQYGRMITKMVTFTEDASNTLHTGTVPIPAGAWLHNIQVINEVLWGAASAAMDVGDTADPNGYFAAVDLKATDLLVGEVLDTTPSTSWGGKEGAYLVAASGRRGPTSSNFAKYYKAGSNIIGAITVGTPAVTTGRTHMLVTYSIGDAIAAVASTP